MTKHDLGVSSIGNKLKKGITSVRYITQTFFPCLIHIYLNKCTIFNNITHHDIYTYVLVSLEEYTRSRIPENVIHTPWRKVLLHQFLRLWEIKKH